MWNVKCEQWNVPSVTKPNPENCKNCSSKCAYDCAQLQYTIQHRTVQSRSNNDLADMSVVRRQTNVVSRLLREKLVDKCFLEAQSAAGRQEAHRLRHRRITIVLLATVSDNQERSETDAHPLCTIASSLPSSSSSAAAAVASPTAAASYNLPL